MGAACSRHNKVTQIKVAPRPRLDSFDTDELFMNFGRHTNYNSRTEKALATSNDDDIHTTYSTLEIEPAAENVKTTDKETSVNQCTTEAGDVDKSGEPKNMDQTGKATPDIAARDTVTKDNGENTIKYKTSFNKKSEIDITRKVGEILDTLIPPDSPVQNSTRVGRQSRLMHAGLNTVVSHDVTRTANRTKQKKRKGNSTVKERNGIITSPESPTLFHVCKHGIPIVEDLDDEEGVGCDKCQRPGSRGGRELKELLKAKKASRKTKRNAWTKTVMG